MQKEIRFGGYSTTPSDYDSRDGELASSLGLVNEDEALRPIAPPVVIDTFGSGVSVVFIHSSQTGYTHFILYDTATHQLKWASQGGSPALIEAFAFLRLIRQLATPTRPPLVIAVIT